MSEKLDWSKLEEMPEFAPTGEGRYVLRCGGVVDLTWNKEGDFLVSTCGLEWYHDGKYTHDHSNGCVFDIVAPAPDVLPWESEPEEYPGELASLRKDKQSWLNAMRAEEASRKAMIAECERLRGSIERRDRCLTDMESILLENLPDKSEMKLVGFVEMLKEVVRVKNSLTEKYRQNWLSIQEATGEQRLETAIERVKGWRVLFDEHSNCTEPTPQADKKTVGLYRKFEIRRTDGSSSPGCKHENCEYFVLDLIHDKFAKPAIAAYVEACKADYPALAVDLSKKYLENHEATPQADQPTFKIGDVVVVPCGITGITFKAPPNTIEIIEYVDGLAIKIRGETILADYFDVRHATPEEKAKFYEENPSKHTSQPPKIETVFTANIDSLKEGDVVLMTVGEVNNDDDERRRTIQVVKLKDSLADIVKKFIEMAVPAFCVALTEVVNKEIEAKVNVNND